MRLDVRKIGFAYGARPVFSDISFALDRGEIVCILGPNGVGKSTLLACLSGLSRPDTGVIILAGQDMAAQSRAAIARELAFVPQAHEAVFGFTVRTVVEMGRAPHLNPLQNPGPADRAIAEAALERLAIRHLADARFTEISGGERQLVMIARVVAQQPSVIILDEPTAHLDFANQARFLDVVRGMADEGLAVIFTTHAPDQAFAIAERTLVLTREHPPLTGMTTVVLTEDILSRTFGVPVHVVATPFGPTCMISR